MSSYQYRCTEQQLEAHLAKIADAGDVVEHIIFKGGRDYVLICRPPVVATVRIAPPTAEQIVGWWAALAAARKAVPDLAAALDGAGR